MNNCQIWLYLLFINLISGIIFVYDKHAARKNSRRIPELTLHLLEILGGVFANFLLMYFLRHKNQKFSYWVWTWIVMIGWMIVVFLAILN